ncbi:uncharacterized protein LOC124615349 [Schistocerca americana]|uniref:uncharacterized protein LOC124615349 n=1 Tax=Schistocerca americana TaxID=7009 RepID=UPI001F4F5BC7|nr:uncharacterized protein LOC124615349 [Schistocerca americana]
MRLCVVVLLLGVAPAVLARYFQYLDKFKDMKDDDVIACMAEGQLDRCSDVLRELRDKFSEIAATNCAKCDAVEKDELFKYFVRFSHRYADASKKIQDRYDPTREYRKKFGEYWTKKGLVLY